VKLGYVALLLLTFVVGCAKACPKSPAPIVCPPTDIGGAVIPSVDEDAVKALDERLAKLRKGGRKTVHYRAPSLEEERAYAAWVRDALVAATERKEPPAKAAPDGFSLRVMGDVWILEESRKKKRGAGAVVIRTGRARPIFVEAPHTFFDKGTLPIALAVFDAQAARALLVNTVHRYIDKPKEEDAGAKDKDKPAADVDDDKAEEADDKGADNDDDKALDRDEIDDPDAGVEIVASDVAHTDRSFYLAAHRELVALVKDNVTVQIHGFRDDKAPDVGVIVSAAKGNGEAGVLTTKLGAALPETKVSAYPTDVKTLGGTTNVEARASREMGAPFFHIEISRSMRDKLESDKALRGRFAAALDPIVPTNPGKPPSP
jgi:hypothetical protein